MASEGRVYMAKYNEVGFPSDYNNERLQLALRATGLGCYDWYPFDNQIFWDDRMHELFGLPKNSKKDRKDYFFSVIHKDDVNWVQEQFTTVLDPKNPHDNFNYEFRILIKRKVKYIATYGFVFRNEMKESIRVIGTCQDITPQKEFEKALKESEERFHWLALSSTQGIAVTINGIVQDANSQLLRMLRCELDELIGKSALKFVPAEERSNVSKKMSSGDTGPYESQMLRKDGTVFYSEIHAAEIDYKGTKARVTAIYDITQRKEAENILRENKEKLSIIFNSTYDLMVLARVNGKNLIFESVNDSFLGAGNQLGAQFIRSELIGMQIDFFLKKIMKMDDSEATRRLNRFQECINKKKTLKFIESTQYEENVIYLEVYLIPILQNKKVTHLLWISRDVSDSTKATLQLEAAFKEVNRLKAQLERENIYLREEIQLAHNFEDMVFAGSSFKQVLNQVEQVAPLNATVLIMGETGTGKELIARAIHNLSPRANRPMIKINCGAIPKDLMESELFGFEKGAFTGAMQAKAGRFELANNGTLLLDEIGELPKDLQVKLLRVLQEGEFERLGSTKTTKVDVRIVAATHRDLKDEVENGNFREDLYFRLNVFPIFVPPLRERKEDIPALVEHFVNKYVRKHGKLIKYISDDALKYFKNYSWPGNIRELENIIERSVILSTGENLFVPDVPAGGPQRQVKSSSLTLDDIQSNYIRKVLKECDWKIEGRTGAAIRLDMKPSTLRDKMKKLGIRRPSGGKAD